MKTLMQWAASLLAVFLFNTFAVAQATDASPGASTSEPVAKAESVKSGEIITPTNQPLYTPGPYQPAGGLGAVKILLYLGVLIAMSIGGMYLLKNGGSFFQPRPKGERKLKLVET